MADDNNQPTTGAENAPQDAAGATGGALLAGLALALDCGWTGGFLAYGCGATAIAVMLPAPAPRPARRLA